MIKFKTKHKAFALRKTGAAVLITAALLTLVPVFTACPNNAGGNKPGGSGENPSTPPSGKVILTLDTGKLNIIVKAKTADGSDIQVEGCEETTLKSDKAAELHAKGTIVTLKGKISELLCHNNQLVALNVQGCTALEKLLCRKNKLTSLNVQGCTALKDIQCQANQLTGLDIQGLTALEKLLCNSNQLTSLNVQGCTALKDIQCQANQLNADVFKKLFIDLPACKSSDDAEAILYTEETGANEGNHKDFTNPPELKAAFDDAKSKNWTLTKKGTSGNDEEI